MSQQSSSSRFDHAAQALVESFANARPMHANSLILSVYGDTIYPFGSNIWLGSLIRLVEPLGINQRLVRTSVFRLAEKNILSSRQVGRRSFYTLTHRGFRQFSSAAKRIYAPQASTWDGQWRLVITLLGNLEPEQRETLRKELFLLGFTHITTGVFAHPTTELTAVRHILHEMQLTERVVMLQASAPDAEHIPVANGLIRACFKVDTLDEEYRSFIDLFQPVLEAARQTPQPDPQLSFLVRTLLIHKYRRILLREPELPPELLQQDSPSQQARRMTASLYQRITSAANQHFVEVSESEHGAFSEPGADYYQRFAGIPNHGE